MVNEEVISMWQLAEWRIWVFQLSFPRINDRLSYEETGERKLILRYLVLLYNYHANKVGIYQIRSTYNLAKMVIFY